MRRFLAHAVLATSVVIAIPALLVWSLLPSRGARASRAARVARCRAAEGHRPRRRPAM